MDLRTREAFLEVVSNNAQAGIDALVFFPLQVPSYRSVQGVQLCYRTFGTNTVIDQVTVIKNDPMAPGTPVSVFDHGAIASSSDISCTTLRSNLEPTASPETTGSLTLRLRMNVSVGVVDIFAIGIDLDDVVL